MNVDIEMSIYISVYMWVHSVLIVSFITFVITIKHLYVTKLCLGNEIYRN